MLAQIKTILDKIIWISYLALIVATPLIFSTKNSELFEVPKMYFVYLIAAVLLFATLTKFILIKKIIIPTNASLLFLTGFIIVSLLSTLTSIDKFTSIYGYPSRLNGSLLSIFAYFIIFTTLLVNITKSHAKSLAVAFTLAALATSLWGIPAYFGRDPSCFVMTGKLTSSCWQKEFNPQERIFSTLGQPNWLSSYLVLAIPISLAFTIFLKKKPLKLFFLLTTATLTVALFLTNSRAGFLGLVASLAAFIALFSYTVLRKNPKIAIVILVSFLLLSVVFGKNLFLRINEFINPPQNIQITRGTESGQIRLVVWKGGLKAFLAKPLLGWGPETFAYSYYLHRPLSHNQTTEWNFFYNKAHNEFLNYLAGGGILTLGFYLAFLIISFFEVVKSKKGNQLARAIIASVLGYQVTIFFGFSIVATQTAMFTLIPLSLLLSEKVKLKEIKLPNIFSTLKPLSLGIFFLLFLAVISYIIRLFLADLYDAKGTYTKALSMYPTKNPFYLSRAAYQNSTLAGSSQVEDVSAIKKSAELAKEALEIAPRNIIVARRVANTYIQLSEIDETFYQDARGVGYIIINLAPNDPQSYLTFAKISIATEENQRAKYALERALQLKPDYIEAKELLHEINDQILKNQQAIDPFDFTQGHLELRRKIDNCPQTTDNLRDESCKN